MQVLTVHDRHLLIFVNFTVSLSLSIAFTALSGSSNVTKPKPLDRPVSRSTMTLAEEKEKGVLVNLATTTYILGKITWEQAEIRSTSDLFMIMVPTGQ